MQAAAVNQGKTSESHKRHRHVDATRLKNAHDVQCEKREKRKISMERAKALQTENMTVQSSSSEFLILYGSEAIRKKWNLSFRPRLLVHLPLLDIENLSSTCLGCCCEWLDKPRTSWYQDDAKKRLTLNNSVLFALNISSANCFKYIVTNASGVESLIDTQRVSRGGAGFRQYLQSNPSVLEKQRRITGHDVTSATLSTPKPSPVETNLVIPEVNANTASTNATVPTSSTTNSATATTTTAFTNSASNEYDPQSVLSKLISKKSHLFGQRILMKRGDTWYPAVIKSWTPCDVADFEVVFDDKPSIVYREQLTRRGRKDWIISNWTGDVWETIDLRPLCPQCGHPLGTGHDAWSSCLGCDQEQPGVSSSTMFGRLRTDDPHRRKLVSYKEIEEHDYEEEYEYCHDV